MQQWVRAQLSSQHAASADALNWLLCLTPSALHTPQLRLRTMITLLLFLSLVAFEEVLAATVACGKACLPGPGWGLIVGMVGGFLGIFCLITCCCMACDSKDEKQEAEKNPMTSTSTAEEAKNKLLPSEKMIVQLVDEQMDTIPFPQAELVLTTFNKLLSDLTAYVGAPDVQGLLVWNIESGDFTQVFDMDNIPRGSVKVRVVTYGVKTFIGIYQNLK